MADEADSLNEAIDLLTDSLNDVLKRFHAKLNDIEDSFDVDTPTTTPPVTGGTGTTTPNPGTTTPSTGTTPAPSVTKRPLMIDRFSNAMSQFNKETDSYRKSLMSRLANTAAAFWIGQWSDGVQYQRPDGSKYAGTFVDGVMTAAAIEDTIPVFATYNIMMKDWQGGFSAGGSNTTLDQFKTWFDREVVTPLQRADHAAIVVIEPDALPAIVAMGQNDQTARFAALSYCMERLGALPKVVSYIDGGHARWLSPETLAQCLKRLPMNKVRGVSYNVSNFATDAVNHEYHLKVQDAYGAKLNYIIDSSRNGNQSMPPSENWANPDNIRIGHTPAHYLSHDLGDLTAMPKFDGWLWIKRTGESDGTVNGWPTAGTWWADGAYKILQAG